MATYHATAQRTATVRVAKVPDHVFLHVRFDLTATFPKGVRQLKLEGKALTLVAGDKKLLPDGKIEMGEFRAGPVTQYFRASDTGKPRGLELVYLIPADGPTRYQLNVANASTTVTVPKPTEAPAHPADDVKRKVIAAKMHHTLPGEPLLGYSGLPKLQTQWTNPAWQAAARGTRTDPAQVQPVAPQEQHLLLVDRAVQPAHRLGCRPRTTRRPILGQADEVEHQLRRAQPEQRQ